MRPRAWKLLSLLAWGASLSCGPRPGAETASDLQLASLGEPATAALVVGCWFFEWSEGPRGAASMTGALPDSVRFRDEVVFATRDRLVAPATHPTGRTVVAGSEVPWEAHFVVNRWWIEDDALQIRFWDGEREEWNVTLGINAGELVGAARFVTDPEPAGDPLQLGLRAVRISCDF